ncbi:uncharacterized protein LOC122023000 [Zingiber officinale]|uniref:uncharacterized protein LOC122023000 n=1 Tax=Zingiber officinale TaxID=94328 RepID=UPI001C4D279F|nr:uncharacterized protein LOC122023000 [Zingiber officinale]
MMILTWVMMMMLRNLKMNQRLLGKNQPLRNLLLFQHHPKMLKGNCQRSSLRKRKWQSWMHFYMKWALQIKIVILHKMRQLQLEQSSEGEKKESVGAPSENRILKKKKSKKEKSSKEQEEHDQNQQKGDIEAEVADATAVDVKERIKKVASMRKKKSSKEMDVEQLNKRASYLM